MPREQRYRCKHCGAVVYANHYSPNHYQHKLFDLQLVASSWVSGSSIRGMAVLFNVSPSTIQRKLEILGRNSLAILSMVTHDACLEEDLVVDGLESFVVSQYFPTNINMVVGKRSQMVYGFNHVVMRRKGRMTERQKVRRAEIEKSERIDPTEFPRRFTELMHDIVEYAKRRQRRVTVWSDEHPVYERVLKGMDETKRWLLHERVSSKVRRDMRNELFPANYMEREVRKDMAEHHRETVCFARNVNNSMHRFALYVVMHNFTKPYRVGTKEKRSHAEVSGCLKMPDEAVKQLLFHCRATLRMTDGFYREVAGKTLHTPLSKSVQTVPNYAFE